MKYKCWDVEQPDDVRTYEYRGADFVAETMCNELWDECGNEITNFIIMVEDEAGKVKKFDCTAEFDVSFYPTEVIE